MGFVAQVQDKPLAATSLIFGGVAVHAYLSHRWAAVPDLLALAHAKDVQGLYLGVAGVGAMLAGFSGVIVVFAMSQGIRRLAKMRISGGPQLETNWLSPVMSSFAATAGAAAAATCVYLKHEVTAVWIFEVVILVAMHAAIRMVWLLRGLVRAIREDDADKTRPGPINVGELISRDPSRRAS